MDPLEPRSQVEVDLGAGRSDSGQGTQWLPVTVIITWSWMLDAK
ncbi:hypothetical protein C8D87_1011339 [Lentzea atacamensis]|uniref:Uncharacterized protein n=1 Tax=Lentzea atacamensis TaxID=531938 RepID=A0ABX9EJE4_9PSEU|nr:hypothetical protein C8D87_1011339 [Lentzea atacamensis]